MYLRKKPRYSRRKILFYNWAPFDESINVGGGVSTYLRNLVSEYNALKDWEIFFLSSGWFYSVNSRCFIREMSEGSNENYHFFAVINSPVRAPGILAEDLPAFLEDKKLFHVLLNFIQEQGGFDVIHFHNFEGLTAAVYKLKDYFPETRFIYTLHNYFPFCPQVNLWRNDCGNCFGSEEKAACDECFEFLYGQKRLYKRRVVYYASCMDPGIIKILKKCADFVRISSFRKKDTIRLPLKTGTREAGRLMEQITAFRETNIHGLKYGMDSVLTVSRRTRDIAIAYGLPPEKTILSYIGSPVASIQMGESNADPCDEVFHLIYIGYARNDKGFFFLLDALDSIQAPWTKNIRVTLAARYEGTPPHIPDTLYQRYARITLLNGYRPQDLNVLLQGVHLGVVPVLWEDNLPQVSLELAAHGVPVLASDLGGASELSRSELFRFRGGDKEDFCRKLYHLFINRNLLKQYWTGYKGIPTMRKHMEELERIYSGVK